MKKPSVNAKLNRTIVVLQADIAYFDARLTLIRPKCKTQHELAQKKLFKLLEQVFSKHLEILMERKKIRLAEAKKHQAANASTTDK